MEYTLTTTSYNDGRKSYTHGTLLFGIFPRRLWANYLVGSMVYAFPQYD
jgi:hypothetical protein